MHHPRWRSALILIVATLFAAACGEGENTSAPPEAQADRPLQPLIYTERPDLSPEAAAVRERRLMRQLLEGANASGKWGTLDDESKPARLPDLSGGEQLGQAIFDALVERDAALWDALFVAPEDYAGMVHLDLDKARQYVDGVQGKSRPVWRRFEPGRPSETPQGGLSAVLEFAGLELGEGRTLEGPVAEEGEPVAQYWGNTLQIRLKGTDVFFELRIPKILRIAHPRRRPGQPMLALGSPVQMSSQLDVYLRAGLHLKPQLLEVREYPYPLAVGNFWRYRRSTPDAPESGESPASTEPAEPAEGVEEDAEAAQLPAQLPATETLLEVTAVDDYGTWRLATLRRSYNDETLTTITQHWLVLPRRIYRCSRMCRLNVDKLSWLLAYLDRETPIYRFPLNLEDGWAQGGESRQEDAVFRVDDQWHNVEVPAGNYSNTVAIEGTGPLGAMDPFHRRREQTRFFAHGRGLVRRVLRSDNPEHPAVVTEKLVESRIMPR